MFPTIKHLAKQAVLRGVELFGLNRFYRHKTRRRLLGLCYHSVIQADCPANDARTMLAVTAAEFDKQMRELRKHWNPVSINQLREHFEHGTSLPDRAVFVSFDDGFRNNLTIAAPILAAYQIPAIVFVTTGFIGTSGSLIWAIELENRLNVLEADKVTFAGTEYPLPPLQSAERSHTAIKIVNDCRRNSPAAREQFMEMIRNQTVLDLSEPWKKELYEFMNWDEVRQLRKSGISIGAHTVSHPILAELDSAALTRELSESKKQIEEELGEEVIAVAYPFGSKYEYSDTVIDTALSLGYRLGFTLREKRNAETLESMRIHRICIGRDLTLPSFRALISGIRNH